jgi:HSP20 family protein
MYNGKSPLTFALPKENTSFSQSREEDISWQETREEGKLSIDVLQTLDEVIVLATMAGTRPEDVSLHLQDDLLTIRGERNFPVEENVEFSCQECYWGKFSRSIVLPVDVKEETVRAEYRNGVLSIRFQKAQPKTNTIPIMVIEE